ncbi:MAG: hypothetical protein VX430_00980 [Pseudomonadota bacterium]|nr:hypothetical protein [Pseudomonadota bacterium]
MRIAILTTGAVRRRFFVESLQREFDVDRVFIENRDSTPPVPTDHSMDETRKLHERDYWYGGASPAFKDIADIQTFESLNDSAAISAVGAIKPDVTLVYGTGLLGKAILGQCGDTCLNFHNGDPEEYRGLDCHLWPLYHRDFAALKMTLHWVEPTLDTGAIVDRQPLSLSKDMPLSYLRRVATELTVEMAISVLREYAEKGAISSTAQRQRGRYYSYMPAVLKDICVRNFERHTAAL